MSSKTVAFINTGFSRVVEAFRQASRFNGLPARDKPLKRF